MSAFELCTYGIERIGMMPTKKMRTTAIGGFFNSDGFARSVDENLVNARTHLEAIVKACPKENPLMIFEAFLDAPCLAEFSAKYPMGMPSIILNALRFLKAEDRYTAAETVFSSKAFSALAVDPQLFGSCAADVLTTLPPCAKQSFFDRIFGWTRQAVGMLFASEGFKSVGKHDSESATRLIYTSLKYTHGSRMKDIPRQIVSADNMENDGYGAIVFAPVNGLPVMLKGGCFYGTAAQLNARWGGRDDRHTARRVLCETFKEMGRDPRCTWAQKRSLRHAAAVLKPSAP